LPGAVLKGRDGRRRCRVMSVLGALLQDGFGYLRSPEADYLPGSDDIRYDLPRDRVSIIVF
jgi:transcription termination factor Rho